MDEKKVHVKGVFVVVGQEAKEILYGVLSVKFCLEGQSGEISSHLRRGLAYCPPLEMHVLYSATFRLSEKEMTTESGDKVAFLALVDYHKPTPKEAGILCEKNPDLKGLVS